MWCLSAAPFEAELFFYIPNKKTFPNSHMLRKFHALQLWYLIIIIGTFFQCLGIKAIITFKDKLMLYVLWILEFKNKCSIAIMKMGSTKKNGLNKLVFLTSDWIIAHIWLK